MSDDFRAWYQEHYPTDRARRRTTGGIPPTRSRSVLPPPTRAGGDLGALQASIVASTRLDILDVGCGDGKPLRFLLELGADIDRAVGHRPDRGAGPNRRAGVNPAMQLTVGDAGEGSALRRRRPSTWSCQFVAFSSMPEAEIRRQAAREMARVCRPGGSPALVRHHLAQAGSVSPTGLPATRSSASSRRSSRWPPGRCTCWASTVSAGHPALAAVAEATPLLAADEPDAGRRRTR